MNKGEYIISVVESNCLEYGVVYRVERSKGSTVCVSTECEHGSHYLSGSEYNVPDPSKQEEYEPGDRVMEQEPVKRFTQDSRVDGMKEAVKTKPVEAKKIEEPFEVETLEVTMKGKPGDYLMRGAAGELYVCDADIFEDTYRFKESSRDQ